jgi:hypothetical protein
MPRPAIVKVVSEFGPHVALVDTFADAPEDEAVVLIGAGEAVLRRLTLGELLDEEEMREQRDRFPFDGWWSRGVHFDFSLDGREFMVTTRRGRSVRIPL